MTIRRMRNKVKLTDVVSEPEKGRPYGFGLILDGDQMPKFVFIPPQVVRQYELTEEDVGEIFDCVFRDDTRRREDKRDPIVVAIIEEDDPIQPSVMVDEYPDEDEALPGWIAEPVQ